LFQSGKIAVRISHVASCARVNHVALCAQANHFCLWARLRPHFTTCNRQHLRMHAHSACLHHASKPSLACIYA